MPNRDPARKWLVLLDDEQRPNVLEAAASASSDGPSAESTVRWSPLWAVRPNARIRFDLAPDGQGGTSLRWTLFLAEPLPDASQLGHFRKRINVLINANLRFSLGQ